MHGYRDRHRHGLIAATVRIVTLDKDKREVRYGTGFLVAPGFAVTCAHVVLPPDPGQHIVVWYGDERYRLKSKDVLVREPKMGAERNHSYPDVALLRVHFDNYSFVPLTEDLPGDGRQLFAYGFPVINDEAFAEPMKPEVIGDRVKLAGGRKWINTRKVQVQRGASGSGAIDDATGEVVGMLTQSRDTTSELGVLLVPTATIIETLTKAGHGDVIELNRRARQEMDTLGGIRRRMGWAFDLLRTDLSTTTPQHRGAMLRALDGDAPADVELDDATAALLERDLDDLGSALSALAEACHSATPAKQLLGKAAPFASLSEVPLAPQETAARLARERGAERPRMVHLPACRKFSVDLLVGRARGKARWEALSFSTADAVTDLETGLPNTLVRAVRATLLDAAFVSYDPTVPGAIEAAWAGPGGRKAIEKARKERRWLLLLPAGVVDSTTVELWRAAFGPCLFVITDPRLSAGLAGSAGLLALPPSLAADDEREVETRYQKITDMIEFAAG